MSELRDVVAAVLTEHRHKSARVLTRLLVEAIEGTRQTNPSGCLDCQTWEKSLGSKSIREQAIQAAKSKGRLEEYARFLSAAMDGQRSRKK